MKITHASRALPAAFVAAFLLVAAFFSPAASAVEITEQKLMELSVESVELREAVKRFDADLRAAIEERSESEVMPTIPPLMKAMGDMIDQAMDAGDDEAEAYAAAINWGRDMIMETFPTSAGMPRRDAGSGSAARDVVGVWRLARIVGLPPEKMEGLQQLGFDRDGNAPPGGSDLALFEFREDGTVSGSVDAYEQEYEYEVKTGMVLLTQYGMVEIKMQTQGDGTMKFSTRDGLTLFVARVGASSAPSGDADDVGNMPAFQTGFFMIANKLSGLYADIRGGDESAGAELLIWKRNDKLNQMFMVTNDGDGNFDINPAHSGKYLSPASGKGGPVVQSVQAYRWRLEKQDDGWYKIVDADSGLCWDVKGNSMKAGAPVVVWSVKNDKDDNQKFRFIAMSAE